MVGPLYLVGFCMGSGNLNSGPYEFRTLPTQTHAQPPVAKRAFSREVLCQTELVSSRQELFHMQREFLKERTRCRALEEELENPMNVHRWRKLEVTPARAASLAPVLFSTHSRLLT